jgi:hypothetical protein
MTGISSTYGRLSNDALTRLQNAGVPSNVIDIVNGTSSDTAPAPTAPTTPTSTYSPIPFDPAMIDAQDPTYPSLRYLHVALFRAAGTPEAYIAGFAKEGPNAGEVDQWFQSDMFQDPEGFDRAMINDGWDPSRQIGRARAGLEPFLRQFGMVLPAPGTGNPGVVPPDGTYNPGTTTPTTTTTTTTPTTTTTNPYAPTSATPQYAVQTTSGGGGDKIGDLGKVLLGASAVAIGFLGYKYVRMRWGMGMMGVQRLDDQTHLIRYANRPPIHARSASQTMLAERGLPPGFKAGDDVSASLLTSGGGPEWERMAMHVQSTRALQQIARDAPNAFNGPAGGNLSGALDDLAGALRRGLQTSG